MRYKYYIEMTWVNGSTTQTIDPSNIKHLLIDCDYENKYMDTIYVIFQLDKNFVDKIILNAKTASIYMNIYKVDVDATVETKLITPYSGEMSYFIHDDINYNKEIDYAGTNSDRTDMYRTVHLGLMFKSCIDNNKQTSNQTFVNTTMINMVHSFLQSSPLLLENFKYNDTISQLIIPPQESTSKVIKFLNNVKVFYDTKYRLYFEPNCTYLISSSGNAVQKSTEQYAICLFTIRAITDTNSNVLGMTTDSANKCYDINVNVKDTNYSMDSDTGKTINSLSCIINPGKDHSLSALASVSDIMTKINTLKSKITSALTSAISGGLSSITGKLTDYKQAFTLSNSNVAVYVTKITAAIDDAKSILTTNGSFATTITQINTYEASIKTSAASYALLSSQYNTSMTATSGCLSTTTNLSSYINAISSINLTDNITPLTSSYNLVTTKSASNITFINQTLMSRINDLNTIVATCDAIVTLLNATQIASLSTDIQTIQTYSTKILTESTSVANYLDSYKSDAASINTILNSTSIKNSISSLKSTSSSALKTAFTGITTDLTGIGNSAKQALNAITSASANIVNVLKSSNLSLSSLSSIEKDITTVTDIENIGMLGVSQFSINLGLTTNGTGNKIIRITNDNVNMLKTIASDIKNKQNQLFLNKNDLDFTVFTINKEYLIKNYSSHSDKDGKFILTKKTVIFMREDDKFMCNTALDFNKLANDTTSSSTVSKMSSASDLSTILKNAETILSSSTGTVSTSNVNNILSSASAIDTAYSNLTTTNSATNTNKDAATTTTTTT